MRKFQPGNFIHRTRFDYPWGDDLTGVLEVVEPPPNRELIEGFVYLKICGLKKGFMASQFELVCSPSLAAPIFSLDDIEQAQQLIEGMR